jgi:hypothetical protein
VFPPGDVWWSIKASGFYWAGLCVALGTVLLALRQREEPTAAGMALFGCLLGLGWWISPLVQFVTVPTAIWLLVRQRGVRRFVPRAIGAAAVGALPWLAANLGAGFPSLAQPKPDHATTYAHRFVELWTTGLPEVVGLRGIRGTGWVLGPVGVLAYLALLVAFARLASRRPWGPLELPLVVSIVFPLLYAVPQATSNSEPRYTLFVAPFVVLFLAIGVERVVQAPVVLAAVVTAAAAFSSLTLVGFARDNADVQQVVSADPAPLVDLLDRLGVAHAYTDYWIAYPLTFDTGGRIVADCITSSRQRAYSEEIARAPEIAWIVEAGGYLAPRVPRALADHGIPTQRFDLGRWIVYLPDRPVTPEELGLRVGDPELVAPLTR